MPRKPGLLLLGAALPPVPGMPMASGELQDAGCCSMGWLRIYRQGDRCTGERIRLARFDTCSVYSDTSRILFFSLPSSSFPLKSQPPPSCLV